LTQIFHWVADSSDFNFQCKPTVWDQPPSTTTVSHFKKSYNEHFDEKFKDIPGAKRFPKEDGTQDAALWGGIFDCYECGLRSELGEDANGVQALRDLLVWVDPDHKSMGFGERFPVDEITKNEVRSQSNRRVEVMMFDEGEEPDMAAAAAEPETMETYLPGVYGKKPVPPMKTARRLKVKLKDHWGFPYVGPVVVMESGEAPQTLATDVDGLLSAPLVGKEADIQVADGFLHFGGKYTDYKHEKIDALIDTTGAAHPSLDAEDELVASADELDQILAEEAAPAAAAGTVV